jgi:hypothetical protein
MNLRTVTVGTIVFLGLGFEQAHGQQKWSEFKSQSGGFKVLMPGTPKEQKVKIPGPNGTKIDQTVFMVDGGSVAHLVAFQVNTAEADNVTKALQAVRDGVAQNFKGKVLESKDVKLAGKYPGLEFQVEVPQFKAVYRSRVYFVGKSFYQVTVLGPMDVVTSQDSDRYLDSFALAK